MKSTILAAAFALSASTVFAGGLHEPVYEGTVVPPTIVEDAAVESGSDEWVIALLAFMTIVVLGVGG